MRSREISKPLTSERTVSTFVALVGDVEALQGEVLVLVVAGAEPAQALFGGLQAIVVSGRGRNFRRGAKARSVKSIFTSAGFFLSFSSSFLSSFLSADCLVCVGGFLSLAGFASLSLLFVLVVCRSSVVFFLWSVGVQFVGRKEWRAQAGRERQFVDLYGVIEVRVRARADPRDRRSWSSGCGRRGSRATSHRSSRRD